MLSVLKYVFIKKIHDISTLKNSTKHYNFSKYTFSKLSIIFYNINEDQPQYVKKVSNV